MNSGWISCLNPQMGQLMIPGIVQHLMRCRYSEQSTLFVRSPTSNEQNVKLFVYWIPQNIEIMSVAADCPLILPLLINKLFLRLEESFAQHIQSECKSTRYAWENLPWNGRIRFLAASFSHFVGHNLDQTKLFSINSFAGRSTWIVWHFRRSSAIGARFSRSQANKIVHGAKQTTQNSGNSGRPFHRHHI